jgi:patatin-like phospholipase/acyl hydrolase
MSSPIKPPTSSPPRKPVKLLSIDGGGIKGISALLILDAIMTQIRTKELSSRFSSNTTVRLPVDYFDLAAGTSTGGIIALMLFRLRMSTAQALEMYYRLAADVFSPTFCGVSVNRWGSVGYLFGSGWRKIKIICGQPQFSEKPLMKAIDVLVGEHPIDGADEKAKGDAPLVHPAAGKL